MIISTYYDIDLLLFTKDKYHSLPHYDPDFYTYISKTIGTPRVLQLPFDITWSRFPITFPQDRESVKFTRKWNQIKNPEIAHDLSLSILKFDIKNFSFNNQEDCGADKRHRLQAFNHPKLCDISKSKQKFAFTHLDWSFIYL